MRCGELGVEEHEAARLQPLDQPDEADLRGVALTREHAFAEEGAAERHAVEPADETLALPCLDSVAVAEAEKLAIGLANRPVDPGALAVFALFRAAFDDRLEIGIEGDAERFPPHRLFEASRHVEAVERNDAARFGAHPEDFGIVGAFGHGKDPRRICLEQQVGGDAGAGGERARHRRRIRVRVTRARRGTSRANGCRSRRLRCRCCRRGAGTAAAWS